MLENEDYLVFYGSLMHTTPEGLDEDVIREMHTFLRGYRFSTGDAMANLVRRSFEEGRRIEKILGDKEKSVLEDKLRQDFDDIVKLESEKQSLMKVIDDAESNRKQAVKNITELNGKVKYLSSKISEYETELKKLGYRV